MKFDSDQHSHAHKVPEVKTNFVSRLILKTPLTDNPKTGNLLSIIVAIGLVFWCSMTILNHLVPEKIDSDFYFDPATAEPDA